MQFGLSERRNTLFLLYIYCIFVCFVLANSWTRARGTPAGGHARAHDVRTKGHLGTNTFPIGGPLEPSRCL